MLIKLRDILKRKGNQKGFTLVELIIVMAILAVLGGLAVPKFTGILSASKVKANTANVKLLQDAVDLYINNEGVAAADVDSFGDAAAGVIGKGYLKEVPANPVDAAKVYLVTNGVVSVTP